jgi:predicted PurR-regulated permease PerM
MSQSQLSDADHGATTRVNATIASNTEDEQEVLHASIKAGSVAQIVIAIVAVLGLIYIAKVFLITFLTSLLLAFMLEPLVQGLRRIRLPRPVGALVAVLLLSSVVGGLTYFFYSRAVDFANELPKYSTEIRGTLAKITKSSKKLQQSTQSVLPPTPDEKRAIPVQVQPASALSGITSQASEKVAEVILAITFVPFIIYFMLTWKEHAHSTTVHLFSEEHQKTAYRTVAKISRMIRSFLVGNVLLGLVNSVVSGAVFWSLHIPYFYFLAVISGFISLVPYLGVLLALLPPIAVGIGVLNKVGVLVIAGTVFLLHVFTINVLYPKIVGRRLKLNPLIVTLALLFWAWIWGAMGLILAVPIVGAAKVICDHVDSLRPLGAWLGD